MAVAWQALPPEEAVAYFRAKGYKPAFSWQDVWGEEHAYAFTVAKATRLDILADIRQAVDVAIAEGKTLAQFSKELTPTLQAKGWWGRRPVADPLTGETKSAQLGSPRRLQIIYDTNVRTAHAVGRWEQIQRSKEARPFLRYSAVLDSNTRPEHRAWHGLCLPVDDAWWHTHYPPNGWRCRCTVIQLSAEQMERRGWRVAEAPQIIAQGFKNSRTGEVISVPVGIDPGFEGNVGRRRFLNGPSKGD